MCVYIYIYIYIYYRDVDSDIEEHVRNRMYQMTTHMLNNMQPPNPVAIAQPQRNIASKSINSKPGNISHTIIILDENILSSAIS